MDRLFQENDIVFLKTDIDKNQLFKIADKSVIEGEYAYNLEYTNKEEILDTPMFARELTLATEEDKILNLLRGSEYYFEDPNMDTSYTVDDKGIITGVQAIEDNLHIEFNEIIIDKQYEYFVENQDNGISATITLNITEENRKNGLEFTLQDTLYDIGSIFPFERGMVENIGKFYKPCKHTPNTDVILNLLLFLHVKGITYENSTYDEIEQALKEYREIEL